tara:strand:+ start:2901 stop:3398 length:498 start_codon:yes stop_codon:yes gene_type:complete
MIKEIKYLIQLPVFLFIQVYIVSEVFISSFINPFLYLIILIIMPFKIPKWYLLTYAFIFGLLIDVFSGNLGMHSTACIMMAVIKSSISKITIPHNIIEEKDELIIQKIGWKSFVLFSSILIFVHHTALFLLEHTTFDFYILLKILFSTIVTTIIISVTQLFFYRV